MSVTRFLGAIRRNGNTTATSSSNDLAYRDEDGTVRYRTELIGPRLQRYIDNGYTGVDHRHRERAVGPVARSVESR